MLTLPSLGCSDGATLRIDIATDLLPEVEFDRSIVRFEGERIETGAAETQRWLSGARVATFDDLETGTYNGNVALHLGSDAVLERPIRIRVEGDTITTFYLLRSCVGITCPGAGDGPSAVACLGGICVEPGCDESTGEVCASPQCVEAEDCPEVSACFSRTCERGLCLVEDACGDNDRCDAELQACVPRMVTENDAGMDASADVSIDSDTADGGSDVRPPLEAMVAKAFNADDNDRLGSSVAISGDGSTAAFGAPTEASSEKGIGTSGADNDAPASGAVYVFWTNAEGEIQEEFLKASNAERGDFFGNSLALSEDGRVLAVGAPYEDSASRVIDEGLGDNSRSSTGAVYIFERTDGVWVESAYIKAPNADEGDGFGWELDLSADGLTLAVGAPFEASADPSDPDNNAQNNAGGAYIFQRRAGDWSQISYLKASNQQMEESLLGHSISVSADGQRVVVGAILESSASRDMPLDTSAPQTGAAYLYEFRDGAYEEVAFLKADTPDAGDRFGEDVAISADGSVVAVAATQEDGSSGGVGGPVNNTTSGAGAVYLFRESADWAQTDYLKSPTPEAMELFGSQVALSFDGSRVFVGAVGSQENRGTLHIYAQDGEGWADVRTLRWPSADEEDRYGYAVSSSYNGRRLAVGAPFESSGPGRPPSDNSVPQSGGGQVVELDF